MIKELIVFGNAWTHGVESSISYSEILAENFNLKLVDESRPNESLKSIYEHLKDWIENNDFKNSLILVGLPAEESEEEYKDIVNKIDELATKYNVKIIQYNVLSRNYRVKLPTLIDSSSALEMLVIRNKPRKNPLFTEHKFPNEKGHQIIAEFLKEKVKSVII